jgi:exo-beta-1,3-glucanase (GH17 family)
LTQNEENICDESDFALSNAKSYSPLSTVQTMTLRTLVNLHILKEKNM